MSHAEIGRFFDQSMEMRPFQKKIARCLILNFPKGCKGRRGVQFRRPTTKQLQLPHHVSPTRTWFTSCVTYWLYKVTPKKKYAKIGVSNQPTINLIETLGATGHLFTKIRRLTREFHPMLEVWSQHRLAILTLQQLKSRKCLWLKNGTVHLRMQALKSDF